MSSNALTALAATDDIVTVLDTTVATTLATDPTTGAYVNFVPGCPLCLPTIDALQLYRGRPKFHGLKVECDSFGDGLPASERAALRSAGVALIRLATPTTDTARLPAVLEGSSGFLYYVSVAGITGLQQAAQASIDEAVARLKAKATIPVAVGFGVRTPEQAAAIAKVSDGVVVGSALVDLVAQHGAAAAGPVRELTRALAQAVHSAR